ncbi:thioredoxin domain-containing protein [Leucobacter sp. UT-8R-CII-1-4]|uniref:DsbA family protein n=1 Tax=Leucobacter sp. UT-8R-CII-1-4 TaxID=3040075 RepID=UPI0024A8ACCA|nr:thioredoxin domain-containing protein [Leucobacter sp. UT-8R-CII-1-4]MDI6022277.1 thioredoxin domain-containing protein [Leucobacter sp. UT-8R-CII-1-4]
MSDEQQQPEPQWTPVAPPNPYAAEQQAKRSKALAIAAMAVGLVALLTVVVSVAYFNGPVAIAGGVLGLLAVVLGVTALVKKSGPTGASIAGVVSAAVAVIGVTVLFGVGAIAKPVIDPVEGSGEEWTPETAPKSLIDWPENMGSGGVIFEGPGAPMPRESAPLAAGTAPQANQVDRAASNDILVYVDYRCPHCLEFEKANSEFLSQVMNDGNTSVEVVPLSFMDRYSEGTYYSSRASGALACVAENQPDATWAVHNALLSPKLQPAAGAGPNNDDLIASLGLAAGELNSAAAACITDESYVPFAQALTEWVFQNPVPNALDTNLRIQGTPTVLVNGVVFEGDAADSAAFQAFFKEQAN